MVSLHSTADKPITPSALASFDTPTGPRTTHQRPAQNYRRSQRRYIPSCRSPIAVSQRVFGKRATNKITSAQNLHHRPANPRSFSAAALHVTHFSPINPIIVISDMLTGSARLSSRRVAAAVKLAPERYDDAHQGEQDTEPRHHVPFHQ